MALRTTEAANAVPSTPTAPHPARRAARVSQTRQNACSSGGTRSTYWDRHAAPRPLGRPCGQSATPSARTCRGEARAGTGCRYIQAVPPSSNATNARRKNAGWPSNESIRLDHPVRCGHRARPVHRRNLPQIKPEPGRRARRPEAARIPDNAVIALAPLERAVDQHAIAATHGGEGILGGRHGWHLPKPEAGGVARAVTPRPRGRRVRGRARAARCWTRARVMAPSRVGLAVQRPHKLLTIETLDREQTPVKGRAAGRHRACPSTAVPPWHGRRGACRHKKGG